jgi:hypothetical protein
MIEEVDNNRREQHPIDRNHDHFNAENFRLKSSVSIEAAASSALSHLKFPPPPSRKVFCMKRFCVGLPCINPNLTAVFNASLKESRLSFIAVRRRASTSGSNVTVVLTLAQ